MIEELKKGIYKQYNPEIDLYEENVKLKDKVEELQDRIDKAIEYINVIKETTPSLPRNVYAKMILINYEDLLDILKGENNE